MPNENSQLRVEGTEAFIAFLVGPLSKAGQGPLAPSVEEAKRRGFTADEVLSTDPQWRFKGFWSASAQRSWQGELRDYRNSDEDGFRGEGGFLAEEEMVRQGRADLMAYGLSVAPELLSQRRVSRGSMAHSWMGALSEGVGPEMAAVLIAGAGDRDLLEPVPHPKAALPEGRMMDWTTMLHCAAIGGTQEAVALFIDAVGPSRIDTPDSAGNTALCEATLAENVGAMRALLEAGADPSVTGRLGRSAESTARDFIARGEEGFALVERELLARLAGGSAQNEGPKASRARL